MAFNPSLLVDVIASFSIFIILLIVLSVLLFYKKSPTIIILIVLALFYLSMYRLSKIIIGGHILGRTLTVLNNPYENSKVIITEGLTKLFGDLIHVKDNFYPLPDHPVIYMSNYVNSVFEYSHSITMKNVCLLSKDYKGKELVGKILSKVFRDGENHISVNMTQKGNYEKVEEEILNCISKGKSIYVYPERNNDNQGKEIKKKKKYGVKPFRSGIFNIAYKHNIPIVMLANDHIDDSHLCGSTYYKIRSNEIIPKDYDCVETLVEGSRRELKRLMRILRDKDVINIEKFIEGNSVKLNTVNH